MGERGQQSMTIEYIDNIIGDLNGMVLTLHEIRRVFASVRC